METAESTLTHREKMQYALDLTIDSYLRLIKNPSNEISNWQDFGSTDKCRFCLANRENRLYNNCAECVFPAIGTYEEWVYPCIDSTFSSFKMLVVSTCVEDGKEALTKVVNAAIDRLIHIYKCAIQTGYFIDGEHAEEIEKLSSTI